MNGPDELRRENAALRERISTLSAAILRISASLDLDTVLREVVDSARALTGARYGMIATVDERGAILEFIAPGLTPEERRHIGQWPHGYPFFEHLRDLPGALRLADLPAYARSLGYSEELTLSKTPQAMPIRHRGVHVGNFFLGEKAGGRAFTDEDEEILVLFASQAATAIAHARAHRDEQRAHADLEALVDNSPVGVVVFDAKSGRPVSFNREAKRIVGGLRSGDSPTEQLLEVMICRRGDGREIRLGELPLTDELRNAETVRAEEIELSVPDGRRVTTLVNSTPIHAADGAVESVVVTLQDLAPLEELERLRTQFLGMVSHELRAPLTSIKGSAATLLTAKPELDPAEMREFFRIIDEQADHMRGLVGDLLDVGRIDTGTLSVRPEPAEVASLVDRARNTFLSGGGRHNVLIDLPRAMADRRRIVQVLNNLFSNASRHAPESSPIVSVRSSRDGANTGARHFPPSRGICTRSARICCLGDQSHGTTERLPPIRVTAVCEGVYVAISVADEGRGVAPERLPRLFRKYTDFAGGDRERALGAAGHRLAIRKGLVEAHGGRIRATSGGAGQGTRVHLHAAGGRGGRRGRRGGLRPGPPARTPGTGRSGRPSSWWTTTR